MEFDDLITLAIVGMFAAMLAIELVRPARRFAEVRGWTFVGVCFLILLAVINTLVALAIPAEWVRGHALLDGARLGVAGGTLAGVVVVSFVDYWLHRAEHRFDWLWRWVHQLHHSQERVDIPGAVFFHPFDMVLLVLEALAVNVLVLGLDPRATALAGFAGAFLGFFQHWNIRTPHWLGYVIQRPEAHYRHHERGVHAFNYGNVPLWDIVFGTFHNPREVPADLSASLGFGEARGRRFWAMLWGRDVNADRPEFTHFD